MNFQDDLETQISGHTDTVNDAYDVINVRFKMRRSEFDVIMTGTEADKDAFLAWLLTADG